MRTSTLARRAAATIALTATALMGTSALTAPAAEAATPTAKVRKANLLRAHSFTDHGYAKVSTYDNWEGDGDFRLRDCGMFPSYESKGFVNEKFRMYVGAQTMGQADVIQFSSRKNAAAYVKTYSDAVAQCPDNTGGSMAFGATRRPTVHGSTSAGWWAGHSDLGVSRTWLTVSVVREGDRVSLLVMSSTTSNPKKTMDVPALMQDMADRLALD